MAIRKTPVAKNVSRNNLFFLPTPIGADGKPENRRPSGRRPVRIPPIGKPSTGKRSKKGI